jgi:hypothetical protein
MRPDRCWRARRAGKLTRRQHRLGYPLRWRPSRLERKRCCLARHRVAGSSPAAPLQCGAHFAATATRSAQMYSGRVRQPNSVSARCLGRLRRHGGIAHRIQCCAPKKQKPRSLRAGLETAPMRMRDGTFGARPNYQLARFRFVPWRQAAINRAQLTLRGGTILPQLKKITQRRLRFLHTAKRTALL